MRLTLGSDDYEVVAIPVATTSASKGLISAPGFVVAVALAATAGGAASADVLDGDDANGGLLVPFTEAASGFLGVGFGLPGIPADVGLYLAVTAGSVRGSISFAVLATKR